MTLGSQTTEKADSSRNRSPQHVRECPSQHTRDACRSHSHADADPADVRPNLPVPVQRKLFSPSDWVSSPLSRTDSDGDQSVFSFFTLSRRQQIQKVEKEMKILSSQHQHWGAILTNLRGEDIPSTVRGSGPCTPSDCRRADVLRSPSPDQSSYSGRRSDHLHSDRRPARREDIRMVSSEIRLENPGHRLSTTSPCHWPDYLYSGHVPNRREDIRMVSSEIRLENPSHRLGTTSSGHRSDHLYSGHAPDLRGVKRQAMYDIRSERRLHPDFRLGRRQLIHGTSHLDHHLCPDPRPDRPEHMQPSDLHAEPRSRPEPRLPSRTNQRDLISQPISQSEPG